MITGFDQRLVSNPDGSVTYYGPGGLTGVFTPNGAGGYVNPPQFPADLVPVAGGGWTLTDHGSQTKLSFTAAGRLTSTADRDGNTTTFSYTGAGFPASVVSSRGSVTTRTVTIATSSGGMITSLTQTVGYSSRTVTLGYSSLGHLSSVTDTVGGVTQFAGPGGADTGQVAVITNPAGQTTTLGFTGTQAGAPVASVAQSNPSGAGTSTTRLTYPSGSQTLVADPTTDQSEAVGVVPHTTYNLTTDGSQLVASATDPDGHSRSASYTPLQNLASATPAAGGATTFSYGANSGESLTQVASPGGATGSAAYTNTGTTKYLPSSTTNDAGNAIKYSYNGTGNPTSTAQGTGPVANVTYNSDGTAATSASPGAASGVVTSYGYDSTHQLTSMTPVTGSSLGSRAYTWDGFGRLATATDGAGHTLTYAYDNADRITSVAYSDGTPTVSYTYDSLGRVTKRVDGVGTTTYTWDTLGHLLSTVNTAGGGTISYHYDLAGALASTTTGMGTTSYGYDSAHLLVSMTYPQGGSMLTTRFANDANGRRTDTWLQSPNANNSVWAAHSHTTYDNSGRVTHVTAQNGPATTPTTTVDLTYCFNTGAAAPTCSTATGTDRAKIAWVANAVTGETTSYTYDGNNRLTQAAVTGGANPRTYTYTYDAAGNRLTSAVTGSSPVSRSWSFNNANQISTPGYTYDGAGNLTNGLVASATYNAAGQTTSTGGSNGSSYYSYAGTTQNELLKETQNNGVVYHYTYGRTDQNGLPMIETAQVGTSTGYVLHDPTGAPVMLQTSSGVTCLYVYDGTGNPVSMSTSFSTTAFTYQYDPTGNATQTAGGTNNGITQNPYLFHAGVQDRATGRVKFGARWYDPRQTTWTQQDAQNAPLDPANANRYTYASADPINNIDPTGGSWWPAIGGGTVRQTVFPA